MSGARVFPVVVMLLLLAGFLPALGWAQNTDGTDQQTIPLLVQQIKELQKQTADLQEKVKTLEAKGGQVAASPEVAAPTTAAPEQVSDRISAIEAWDKTHGIQWRGFGEVDYKALDQRKPELATAGFNPGSAGNFYTANTVLLLTSRITDKASVLSEFEFEEEEAQAYSVSLERILLKYDYDDHMKVSFGRYHTGIGYYNTAFHSGAWLQTTADRPLIMEFARDGGLLPTQAIGVSVTGSVPSGKAGLNYIAEYGTSDTNRPDINGSGLSDDENNGNHVNLGLFLRPDRLPGLQIGASYYHDRVSNSETVFSPRYGQTIVNGHIVYVAHGLEFLNEGFLIRYTQLHTPVVFDTPAFYSQISRRFGKIRPFFRYQYINGSAHNPIHEDVGLRHGPSFGARYDLDDYIAFKAQLDHTLRRGQPDLNGLHLQLAFTF